MRIELVDRSVDADTGRITTGATLTQFECGLLRYLVGLDGGVATRDALLRDVWGYPKGIATRAVDTAMRRLRKKLEVDPKEPRHLFTIQGEGYRWVAVEAAAESSWEARRGAAEALYGRSLALSDPEVGLHDELVLAFEQGLAQLSASQRRLVGRLSGVRATPAELGSMAAEVPLLADRGWVQVQDGLVGLAEPWRSVAPAAGDAWMVALWTTRVTAGHPMTLSELEGAMTWAAPSDDLARLLLAAEPSLRGVRGHFSVVLRLTDGLLATDLPIDLRCALRVVRANCLRAKGLLHEAHADAQAAIDAAPIEAVLGDAWGVMGLILHTQSEWLPALHAYDQAVQRVAPQRPWDAAKFLAESASVRFVLGDAQGSLDVATRAHDLAVRVLASDAHHAAALGARARSSRMIATALLGLGRVWEAMPRLEQLMREAEQERPNGVGINTALHGFMAMMDVHEVARAEPWLHRAQRAAEAAGEQLLLSLVDGGWGIFHAVRGEYAQAQEAFDRNIVVLTDAKMPERTIIPRMWLVMMAHQQGRVEEAHQLYQLALSHRPDQASPGVDGMLGSVAEVLGLQGPSVSEAALVQMYVRVARRAWGLPVQASRGSLLA